MDLRPEPATDEPAPRVDRENDDDGDVFERLRDRLRFELESARRRERTLLLFSRSSKRNDDDDRSAEEEDRSDHREKEDEVVGDDAVKEDLAASSGKDTVDRNSNVGGKHEHEAATTTTVTANDHNDSDDDKTKKNDKEDDDDVGAGSLTEYRAAAERVESRAFALTALLESASFYEQRTTTSSERRSSRRDDERPAATARSRTKESDSKIRRRDREAVVPSRRRRPTKDEGGGERRTSTSSAKDDGDGVRRRSRATRERVAVRERGEKYDQGTAGSNDGRTLRDRSVADEKVVCRRPKNTTDRRKNVEPTKPTSKRPSRDVSGGSTSRLKNELRKERSLATKLCRDLEDPRNFDRWRRVGEDVPDEELLRSKVGVLQQRLSDNREMLLEKELVLEEVTALTDRLRAESERGRSRVRSVVREVNEYQREVRSANRTIMAAVSELSMYQANAIRLEEETEARRAELEAARGAVERGEPPDDDAAHELDRVVRERHDREVVRRPAERPDRWPASYAERTTAEPRPSAYVPENDAIGVPKPYGSMAPFKPAQPGSTMRHIRAPETRKIEI